MHKVRTNYSSCIAGAVKIYVAAVEALRRRERQDETQFCEFQPPFLQAFFLNLTPCMTKLRVRVLCFPHFMNNYDFFTFKKKNQQFFCNFSFIFSFEIIIIIISW
jgi:hypothetical protein